MKKLHNIHSQGIGEKIQIQGGGIIGTKCFVDCELLIYTHLVI